MLLQRSRIALIFALFAFVSASASAASFPPGLRFHTLDGARVRLHFHDGLELQARRAVSLADEALQALEQRYGARVGRVEIVLSDVVDAPNGFALPMPYPLVHVYAAAPDGADGLGNLEGWLRLVLTHELAHVVHLDQARGLPRLGRKVFGRAPFLFPNLLTPGWMIEGLATYEETEATAFGRGRSPQARMVRRMAALERRQPRQDQAVLGLDRWPGGDAQYLFGEAFLRDLSERFGPETLPELARGQAGRPVPFFDDLTSKQVTGASFHARWREWQARERATFEAEAETRRAAGLTESRALTARGVRQVGPRFSPDGAWIAYTSATLTRFRAVRLMRADGSDDRRLAERAGGEGLAWTPDGRTLVFDESEVERLFSTRSGLRALDVASGRRRWIARGQRLSDPDVSPGGGGIVCVRRHADRSELALVALDGGGLRDLTSSAPDTQWGRPRFSPDGDLVAASRFLPGGWVDLVLVDPRTGALRELTHDRAVDAEPAFTPDGSTLVFRSERDGVSNLYAVDVAGGAPRRLTNVLGGAFTPDVAPDGRALAFAAYTSRGYDLHLASLDVVSAPVAPDFVDPYPAARQDPTPAGGAARPYRPWGSLRPRFWSPYLLSESGETRLGAFTGGFDPLFRHAWGVVAARGVESERVTWRGFWQYDAWRPTLLAYVSDESEPLGRAGRLRTRGLTLRATLPVARSVRATHSVSLGWRVERATREAPVRRELPDRGALEAAYTLSSAKLYPFSISPSDGWRLRLAYLIEDPAFGGEAQAARLTFDARAYARLGESGVLALRAGGGTAFGRRFAALAYSVGGFPDGELFDLGLTNPAVLRGYPDAVASGRHAVWGNAELRLPLLHPQGGWRTAPLFLRHVHAAVFADAAHAWNGALRASDVSTSAGLALGTDAFVGHGLPLTASVGLARGFGNFGETRAYVRLGLAF
jgi:hypothetical protein